MMNRRYQELMQSDGYVTAARLRDACLGLGVKRETLLKLFEQHNEEFIKDVYKRQTMNTCSGRNPIHTAVSKRNSAVKPITVPALSLIHIWDVL